MNSIDIAQGSPEWLAWRQTRRMASETPTVTRRSPYQTWEALRGIKRGATAFQTAAMAHGHQYEPMARAWAQAELGMLFKPTCIESGDYGASLDGIDGRAILEIKCPFKGRESDTWKMADRGLIRPDYDDQVVHQLGVAEGSVCYFVVFDAQTQKGIIIERTPDADLWADTQKKWDDFWAWHLTDDPDPAKNIRTDEQWSEAAAFFTAAKRQADAFAKMAEEYRANLLALAGDDPNTMGGGVKVTRYEVSGSVDYKKAITTLAPDADLEQFRKKSSTQTRVTID